MNGVSLFANVGIAETYIKNHNIDIVVANELLDKRAEFYQESHKDCNIIQGDITKKDLISAPFTVIHPNGIRGVFTSAEINEIIKITKRLVA